MATVKTVQVPANTSLSLRATCASDAEQHVQFSCNGQTVELSGKGNDVEMKDKDGNPFGSIQTGGDADLTFSFWSSANPDPFVFGPEAVANPAHPGMGGYWAGSQDKENQDSYSCSASATWIVNL
jgi:hypothetical protein